MENLEKKLDKMDIIDGMNGGKYECNIRNLSSLEPTNLIEVSNYISKIPETFDIKILKYEKEEDPYVINTFLGNLRTNLKIQLEAPKNLKGLDLDGKLDGIKDEGSVDDALRCISRGYRWRGETFVPKDPLNTPYTIDPDSDESGASLGYMYMMGSDDDDDDRRGPKGGPGGGAVAVPVLSNEKLAKEPQVEKPKSFPGIVFNLEPKYIEIDYKELT